MYYSTLPMCFVCKNEIKIFVKKWRNYKRQKTASWHEAVHALIYVFQNVKLMSTILLNLLWIGFYIDFVEFPYTIPIINSFRVNTSVFLLSKIMNIFSEADLTGPENWFFSYWLFLSQIFINFLPRDILLTQLWQNLNSKIRNILYISSYIFYKIFCLVNVS